MSSYVSLRLCRKNVSASRSCMDVSLKNCRFLRMEAEEQNSIVIMS